MLTSVLLFTEGWNRPDIGALILARPTKSLRLHLQMIGRGLRTAPGKTDCILLDHAGNFHEHGPPDADRAWKLESRQSVGYGEFPEFVRSGERSFATEERRGLLREFRGNDPADAYGSSNDPAVQCLIDHARRKGYKPG